MYSSSDILKSFLNLECTKTGNQKENQEKILMRYQTKSSFKKLLLRPAEVVKKLRSFYHHIAAHTALLHNYGNYYKNKANDLSYKAFPTNNTLFRDCIIPKSIFKFAIASFDTGHPLWGL